MSELDPKDIPSNVGWECNPFGLDYLVVIDLEATCLDPNPRDYIHEVIEFPALLYNVSTLRVVRACLVLLLHTYRFCII